MLKIDPIIAVKNIATSAKWYQTVFECKRKHEGDNFAVMVTDEDQVLICLHKWGEHDHPTMINSKITPGNGLILYFKTKDLSAIRKNVDKTASIVEEDIHLNPNSNKKEFALRDPDGYYLIVTEFHNYEG